MKIKYIVRGIGIGVILASALFVALGGGKKQTLSDAELIKRATELGMVMKGKAEDDSLNKLKDALLKEDSKAVSSGDEVASQPTEKAPKKEELPREGSSEKKGEDKNQSGKTEEDQEASSKEQGAGDTEAGEDKAEKVGEADKEVEKEGKPQTDSAEKEAKTTTSKTENNPSETSEKPGTSEPKGKPEGKPSINTAGKTYTYTVKPGSSAVGLCNDLQAIGLIKDARDFNHYLAVNNFARKIQAGTFTFQDGESYAAIAHKLTSRN